MSLEEEDAARRARAKKNDPTVKILVGLGVVGFFVILGVLGGGDEPYSGRVTDWTPLDEANVQVQFTITNDGDEAGAGECTIEASDASGVVGWDIFTAVDDIEPGDTVRFSEAIRIEDEGAFRVRDVIAKDCEEA